MVRINKPHYEATIAARVADEEAFVHKPTVRVSENRRPRDARRRCPRYVFY